MAQKQLLPDAAENKPAVLRTSSAASDITVRSIHISVPLANPAPAYIAQTAASELITSELERTVLVSRTALHLVNEFLDQVLYNILLTARSTTLGSLKTAVPSVLKPRLGKAALKVAEEDLKEYLEDDEEAELQTRTSSTELKHDFEPDLAWKLARLRCMVYSRLGDLEEEDEEEWLEKEGLRAQLQASKQGSIETGPASAIFMTSIIEYLGEQALYYAGQHAQKRHSQNGGQLLPEDAAEFIHATPSPEDIIIAGKDMNHVGRDSPLSRLWRSYRRTTRESSSRPMSPEARTGNALSSPHSRANSSIQHGATAIEDVRSPDQIPLPMSQRDVDEIEVPGLAPAFSDDEEEEVHLQIPVLRRPASMIIITSAQPEAQTPTEIEAPAIPERNPLRPTWLVKRSISSPVPTLASSSALNRTSAPSVEINGSESQREVSDQVLKPDEPPKPSSSHENVPSPPTGGAFGGAVTAIAGALGMGVLGISQEKKDRSRPTSSYKDADYDEMLASLPKKTVAEEMLGTAPTVSPPTDATTGASITNMSDFYSMHVPVAMSPDSRSPVTPSASKDGEYFPSAAKNAGDALKNENLAPWHANDSVDESRQSMQPVQSSTKSGRAMYSRSPAADSGQRTPTASTHNTFGTTPRSPDISEPTSAVSTNDSRPQSSGSAILGTGTAISIIPPRGASRDNALARHAKNDSRSSVNTPHSRTSSYGNRPVGVSRDAYGRTQTTPQQEVASSPTNSSSVQDARSEVGGSPATKRLQNKPLQLGEESDEAKKKSLEILIRGNETLHYTLTPAAALRDEQSIGQKRRMQNQEVAEPIRTNVSSAQEPLPRSKPVPQPSQVAHPPLSPIRVMPQATSSSPPGGVITPVSPTRTRNPFGEPRDARTETRSSTRDLADYARSTGPNDEKQLPKPLAPRAVSVPRTTSATSQTEPPPQKPVSPSTTKPANRLKHQARDARPSRKDESSDLIDFLREGPPAAGPVREHRIDRRVAPFRTTLDSEDFDNLARGSEDSRPVASVDPSVNSQTPLIVSNGQTSKGTATTSSGQQNNLDSDGMPQRTRRRIKDPYAIYDSDDDDYDLDEEPRSKPPRNQEESLIDFLRNTAPPAGMTTQPILAANPGQRSAEQLRPGNVRASSPHLTQSGTKMDKYRPTQATHASHVERNRSSQSTPSLVGANRPKSRFEPRDARATRANTAELADYLKNSGPAPNAQFQPQPFILMNTPQQNKPQTAAPKEDSSILKRLSRQRKK